MSMFTDAILEKGSMYAGRSPTMNLNYGAQGGFLPRLGGEKNGQMYEEWVSNAAHVTKNVIPVALTYPKIFDYFPQKESWIGAYKAIMEAHPLTIDGLSSGLTAEFAEHRVGRGGEMQEEYTKISRARTQLSMTFEEKLGKGIQKFFNYWMRYGMEDPDTGHALASNFININEAKFLYTPDWYTGSCLYIEPDATNRYAHDAWLCVNLAPKSDGERTGKRDLGSAGELKEHSIEFTSITMHGDSLAVMDLANKIIKQLNILRKIPDEHIIPPVSGIDPKFAAIHNGFDTGYLGNER